MVPDTTSIPGYTIFHEEDYNGAAAAALMPQGTPHPLGKSIPDDF
jgi:primary-amine oxidase